MDNYHRRHRKTYACARAPQYELQESPRMTYIESNLVPGEVVIYETRLHWIVMLSHILLGLLLFALPGSVLLYYASTQKAMDVTLLHVMQVAGAALLLCGVVAILVGVIRRRATEM